MGKLTFQAALGGTVDLVGPNTASAVTLNLPATSGDIVGTGSTGVITTGMISGQVAVAQGGTGSATAQTAINTLAGAVTSGSYLRGNGTNVVMSTIQGADVPTLNQNTTGTAANVTGIVAVANGGTGTTTPALVAGTNVTITGSWPNQTINSSGGGSGMIYPGAGIPLSTGSAWGTSYGTTGTAGYVVLSGAPTITQPNLTFPKIDSIQASASTGVTTILGFTNNAGTANGPYLNISNATPASNNPVVLTLSNAGVYSPSLELQPAAASGSYVVVNNGVTPSIQMKFSPTGTASTYTILASAQTTNRTVTLPDATDTLVGKNTADVLTNKTINAAASGNSIYGISLITATTGTLPVNRGGTDQTSYTDGQLLIGNSTGNTLAKATLTAGTGITITNGAGSITIASSVTAVTSVTGTSPVVSSGGATPAISLATAYGDTLNPYASKTANYVLAAPNGTAGVPTFRAIVAADIPTLNQNTTGTAANVTGTVAIANGGTNTTATPTAGGITYGTGTAQAYSAVGTAGQVLTSNGAAAPSWTTVGGLGTVTSVGTGAGLTGGPITTTGTIALATTAVTAGSYTSTDITVDAYGRITAASNGSGGSGITAGKSIALNIVLGY